MSREHIATVRMIKDGRVTIPSDIRELEGIEEGDYVKITIEKIETNKKKNRTKKANINKLLKQEKINA